MGLVVSGSVVIDAPPYARSWALGRPAAELLSDPRADTAWIPMHPDDQALAIFRQHIPATVIEEIPMTVAAVEQTENWNEEGGVMLNPNAERQGMPAYPEPAPYKLANHTYTWSPTLPDGSMLVIRAQTAEGLTRAVEDLTPEQAARMVAAWQRFSAGPQAAPAALPGPVQQVAQAYPTPAPVPPQPAPGVPGAAPAAWQNAGAPQPPAPPQGPAPEYNQNGWYRVGVPFKEKGEFDAIAAQYQMKKGRPSEGGHFSFSKADKSWYVHPQYAGAFGKWTPVPA